MEVRGLLRQSVRYYPNRPAVLVDGRRFTFREAWQRGLRLANGLLRMGLSPGDRLGILDDNTVGALDTYLACAAAGIVRVPLYVRNAPKSHLHMLENTRCRALFVSASHLSEVEPIRAKATSVSQVIVRDESYEAWLAAQAEDDPDPAVRDDDCYIIRHTAGTTGVPKGAAYTHRQWVSAGRDMFYGLPPVEHGDVFLHVGPLSHASGYLFLAVWSAGAINVVLEKFDPERTLDTLEQERVTHTFFAPTMINMLVNSPSVQARKFPHLKVIYTGSSSITVDTTLKARKVFEDVLYQGYGQTEAVPATLLTPAQWFTEVEGSQPLRSCGLPHPFALIEVRDPETLARLPVGAEGEIAVQCDGQISGFWESPDATAQRFVDGWVLTGDIGRIDENGFVYILDRVDDMIISGGFNIWPAELENVLMNHPAVLEAAVFAVPDEKWGQLPYAVCVVGAEAQVTSQELIQLCAEELGSYKKPSGVELWTDPLPKSFAGKIQRNVLRNRFLESGGARAARAPE